MHMAIWGLGFCFRQLGLAYVGATGAATVTALGLNYAIKVVHVNALCLCVSVCLCVWCVWCVWCVVCVLCVWCVVCVLCVCVCVCVVSYTDAPSPPSPNTHVYSAHLVLFGHV